MSRAARRSNIASMETGHWFAAPFAMLFTFGYGYVAPLVASEQFAGRKATDGALAEEPAAASLRSVLPEPSEELAA